MKQVTIQRFQLALFMASEGYHRNTGLSLEQVAQYVYMQHIWATDNLYKLPSQEGTTVIIQSNAN